VLALAYPDRIARRRRGDQPARYLLANGSGAVLPLHEPLARSEWLAVADLDARDQDARIFVAAALDRADMEELYATHMTHVDTVRWDLQRHDVVATRDRRLGAIVVSRQPLDEPDAVRAALLDGVAREGLRLLPRFGEADELRARVAFCRAATGDDTWPDLSDDSLLDSLDEWLTPQLGAARRRADLADIDIARAVRSLVPGSLVAALDTLAPTSLTLPGGARRAISYADGRPVVRVPIQEVFGLAETPRIAGGRVPVVLSLLSPASRPIQITADLAGFWRGAYAQVRAEMRGRYPKHDWPQDPARATPTRHVRRSGRRP
jgi:ATP-dependent helicase HrpB